MVHDRRKNGLLTQPVGQKNYLETAPGIAQLACAHHCQWKRISKYKYSMKNPRGNPGGW